MGPNGSGKSTLAHVLAGREGYAVTGGEILYNGIDLLELSAEERARQGIFLAFQYPVEIPGVNNVYFLKAALNALRKSRGQNELDAVDFLQLVREKLKVSAYGRCSAPARGQRGFLGWGEEAQRGVPDGHHGAASWRFWTKRTRALDIDALQGRGRRVSTPCAAKTAR